MDRGRPIRTRLDESARNEGDQNESIAQSIAGTRNHQARHEMETLCSFVVLACFIVSWKCRYGNSTARFRAPMSLPIRRRAGGTVGGVVPVFAMPSGWVMQPFRGHIIGQICRALPKLAESRG